MTGAVCGPQARYVRSSYYHSCCSTSSFLIELNVSPDMYSLVEKDFGDAQKQHRIGLRPFPARTPSLVVMTLAIGTLFLAHSVGGLAPG